MVIFDEQLKEVKKGDFSSLLWADWKSADGNCAKSFRRSFTVRRTLSLSGGSPFYLQTANNRSQPPPKKIPNSQFPIIKACPLSSHTLQATVHPASGRGLQGW